MDVGRFESLTPAQRNVLRLAADHSNDEIASVLGLSRETVKTHLARAKMKLGGMDRGASSRRLRELEADPIAASHPLRVNPTRVIGADTDQNASMMTPVKPASREEGEAGSVHETRASFEHFPSVAREPIARTRFHSLTLSDRLRTMVSITVKLAVAILVMLAVAEALQRLVLSNLGMIPTR